MRGKKFLCAGSVFIIFFLSVFISGCDLQKGVGLEDSLRPVSNISVIEGADNSSITVNKSSDSSFKLDIGNIQPNDFVKSGEHKAWCIAWNQPIQSNNSQYNGIKLYATHHDDTWKPINYLLNIRPSLQIQDPTITYKEIQVAIWTLLDFPEFNLDRISIDDLPSDMVRDGRYDFDRSKVNQIVNLVRENYSMFNFSNATTAAVVVETPSDTQTVIVESDESVWAYGQHSFRNQELREQLGITGTGKGQWGWIFELDGNSHSTELIAGGGDDDGTMDADEVGTIIGSLDMIQSGNVLEVNYSTSYSYLIDDMHLWVGCSLDDFPWVGNNGNVAPGGFPYHYDGDPTNSYTFPVDLSTYSCSGNIYVAAHAGELFFVENNTEPNDPVLVFRVTDLSQFGLSSAVDINDHGHIVGGNYYWNADNETLTDMGIPARAMNNHGEVISRNQYWDEHNGATEIDTLDNNDYNGSLNIINSHVVAYDINDNGKVVGEVDSCFRYPSWGDDIPEDYCEYDFWSMDWDLESRITREIRFFSFAKSINNSDQVTGVDYLYPPHEIYVSFTDFGSYNGFDYGEPYAINNQGQVVGSIRVDASDLNNLVALKESKDPLQDLSNIKKFQRITTSTGTFDPGHVIEMVQNSTYDAEIFNFGKGEKSLSKNAPYNSKMFQVWGKEEQQKIIDTALSTTYQSEAFLWDEINGILSLGSLGGNWSTAFDINDHGQVVGYSSIGNSEHRAFYWDQENGLIELPTLSGGNSIARAINNNGQIVGESDGIPVMWEVSFESQNLVVSNR